MVSFLISMHFGSPRFGLTIKFQTVDPEIISILIFQRRILYVIFREKCLLCYIVLTDQILSYRIVIGIYIVPKSYRR